MSQLLTAELKCRVLSERLGDANDAGHGAASGYFSQHLGGAGDLAELSNLVHGVFVHRKALAVAVAAVAAHVEGRAVPVDGFVVCASLVYHAHLVSELVPAQDVTIKH
jgi:hypothetical protein